MLFSFLFLSTSVSSTLMCLILKVVLLCTIVVCYFIRSMQSWGLDFSMKYALNLLDGCPVYMHQIGFDYLGKIFFPLAFFIVCRRNRNDDYIFPCLCTDTGNYEFFETLLEFQRFCGTHIVNEQTKLVMYNTLNLEMWKAYTSYIEFAKIHDLSYINMATLAETYGFKPVNRI